MAIAVYAFPSDNVKLLSKTSRIPHIQRAGTVLA